MRWGFGYGALNMFSEFMRSQLSISELEQTSFSIERQFHVLKHFKTVDEEYVKYLQDNLDYTADEITHQLDVRGSDFYEGFASNPENLWDNLKTVIREERIEAFWINEKCEIQVDYAKADFPDGIGEDHLVHISDLPAKLRQSVNTSDWKSLRNLAYSAKPKSTWLVQVILRKMEKSPEVISIFPGTYAPPLPNLELQNEDDYARSLGFWSTHVVLKP